MSLLNILDLEVEEVPALFFGGLAKMREEAEEKLDELIRAGEDRARKWKEKLVEERKKHEGEEEKDSLQKKIQKLLSNIGIVTDLDLEELEKRIDSLSSSAVHVKSRSAKKRAAKKASFAKSTSAPAAIPTKSSVTTTTATAEEPTA